MPPKFSEEYIVERDVQISVLIWQLVVLVNHFFACSSLQEEVIQSLELIAVEPRSLKMLMPVVEVVVRPKLLSQFLGVVFAELLFDLPAVIAIFFKAGSRNAHPLRLAVDFDKLRMDGSFVSALSVVVVVQQDGLLELRVSAYMNNFILLRHFDEGPSSFAASERTDAA